MSPALAGAIASVFDPVAGLDDAQAILARIARTHYENFSIVSKFVPRSIRQDFFNLYAFCRAADDFGDETGDIDRSLQLLAALRTALNDCYEDRPAGAVFVALRETIQRYRIPIDPFLDLISAFEQDQRIARYESYPALLDYCRRSANPVGRLVLYLCGYDDARRQSLADRTCTALQLTNFWQDVKRDRESLGRVYIPEDWMKKFGLPVSGWHEPEQREHFQAMIRYAVEQTECLFTEGDELIPTLSGPVASHIALFSRGGRAVLDAIRAQNFDTLRRRPSLSRFKKARLVTQAISTRAMTLFLSGK